MVSMVSEILWLRWLLKDLEATQVGATSLFCDNQVACHIANNPVFHERTKHVEMDCYFVCERVESKDTNHEKFQLNIKSPTFLLKLWEILISSFLLASWAFVIFMHQLEWE